MAILTILPLSIVALALLAIYDVDSIVSSTAILDNGANSDITVTGHIVISGIIDNGDKSASIAAANDNGDKIVTTAVIDNGRNALYIILTLLLNGRRIFIADPVIVKGSSNNNATIPAYCYENILRCVASRYAKLPCYIIFSAVNYIAFRHTASPLFYCIIFYFAAL